ncbi:UNVERIFIED_CONTAM: thioredoxin reductase (NADPH) [Brevibacillus sp. OAP136]
MLFLWVSSQHVSASLLFVRNDTMQQEKLLQKKEQKRSHMEQVIIIGAGPCGLSAAIELKKAGIDALIIEKGAVVQSISNYPTYMIFHSTPELLEIGEVPFTTIQEKPSRQEALNYYRITAKRYQLRIQTYEKVVEVEPLSDGFRLTTQDRFGDEKSYDTKRVIIATGYFDHPNKLGIPGEELPKVSSRYTEAHPYTGMNVAIVGGNNSAVDAALDLERAGANVTVVYRGAEVSSHVKAWTKPLFLSAAEKGKINVMYSSAVKEIRKHVILVQTGDEVVELANDFVFTLIGFRPDRSLLQKLGVSFDEVSGSPAFHPETMETAVPNLYIAGVIAAGYRGNSIFIENGRHHGKLIAAHIVGQG